MHTACIAKQTCLTFNIIHIMMQRLKFNFVSGAATRKPDAVEPGKPTDHTVKIAGVIAGILLFVIIFLGVVLVMKKR